MWCPAQVGHHCTIDMNLGIGMLRLHNFPGNTHLIAHMQNKDTSDCNRYKAAAQQGAASKAYGLMLKSKIQEWLQPQLLEPKTGRTGIAQPGLPDRGSV